MLFDLTNLPYWILLGMGVSLFLVVIFSGAGDHNLDADGDVDVDVGDSPVDLDTDADGELSLGQVLGWFGIGRAPLILLLAMDLSLIGAFGWMLNVLLSEILGQLPDSLLSGIVFAIALVAALTIGSLLSRPIGQVFASFGEDTSRDRLIGCIGTVSSGIIPPQQEKRIGQVDVIDPARNRVTIHAMLPEWATGTPRMGDKVLVIDRQSDNYLVILKDSPDHDRWFNASSPEKS